MTSLPMATRSSASRSPTRRGDGSDRTCSMRWSRQPLLEACRTSRLKWWSRIGGCSPCCRARGYAVVEHDPAIVRVVIGTTQRVPSWPGTHELSRLLVEVPGGRWHAEEAARAAGFQVLACPGPLLGWSHCPALRGEPCPLAADADVIVDAVPDEPGRSLLEAHHRIHPSVPICVELPSEESDPGVTVSKIPRGSSDAVVMGILERLAKETPVRGRPQREDTRQSLHGLPDGSGAGGGGDVP